ncbi:MAG: hypothetical protein AAF821_06065 [Cyanobacteria bacterium P01_D01_bin.156]
MLIALTVFNVAIALLCFLLSWRIIGWQRQIIQLNRDLNRWMVFLEGTLTEQALNLTQQRTQLRLWQLNHLQWQLQQRQLIQLVKFLKLLWFISKRR